MDQRSSRLWKYRVDTTPQYKQMCENTTLTPHFHHYSLNGSAQDFTLSSIQPSSSSNNPLNNISITRILSRIRSVERIQNGATSKPKPPPIAQKYFHQKPECRQNNTRSKIQKASSLNREESEGDRKVGVMVLRLKAENLQLREQMEGLCGELNALKQSDVKYKAMMYDKLQTIRYLESCQRNLQEQKEAQAQEKDKIIQQLCQAMRQFQGKQTTVRRMMEIKQTVSLSVESSHSLLTQNKRLKQTAQKQEQEIRQLEGKLTHLHMELNEVKYKKHSIFWQIEKLYQQHYQPIISKDAPNIKQRVLSVQAQNKQLRNEMAIRERKWAANLNSISRAKDADYKQIKQSFMDKLRYYRSMLLKCGLRGKEGENTTSYESLILELQSEDDQTR